MLCGFVSLSLSLSLPPSLPPSLPASLFQDLRLGRAMFSFLALIAAFEVSA